MKFIINKYIKSLKIQKNYDGKCIKKLLKICKVAKLQKYFCFVEDKILRTQKVFKVTLNTFNLCCCLSN